MSNEVKTKEKVDMDPKYIITLTVTLLVTCVIVAGLLGLVNGVTAGPIAEINRQKTQDGHAGQWCPIRTTPPSPRRRWRTTQAHDRRGHRRRRHPGRHL